MTARAAIVTGGYRGPDRAMTLGLAGQGIKVLAVGHLRDDVVAMADIDNARSTGFILHPQDPSAFPGV
jgi:NAD(P)-dependent dehydrogenase (short-subunit alcohol dehydrogenase family)